MASTLLTEVDPKLIEFIKRNSSVLLSLTRPAYDVAPILPKNPTSTADDPSLFSIRSGSVNPTSVLIMLVDCIPLKAICYSFNYNSIYRIAIKKQGISTLLDYLVIK